MLCPRGGQGLLERPARCYAEVACGGKGPVRSCIANPVSGHAMGSVYAWARRPRVPTQRPGTVAT